MTLAEFAWVLGVSPKWILNTQATLGRSRRYSLALARQFAVMRAIRQATGLSLARSITLAAQALRLYQGTETPVNLSTGEASIGLVVDVQRILSAFHTRCASLRTTFAPRQRGRRLSAARDPLHTAADWGVDLGLLRDNAGKSVEQRVRQLDAMVSFAQRVQRSMPSPR